jgi:hypothetical protein
LVWLGPQRIGPNLRMAVSDDVAEMQDAKGLIKVGFVRTKESVSDIGTKNVDTQTYKYHEGRLLKDRPE